MDKLKAFETFVSVATKGSLTAAARAEGVAPAIIGRRLDALEESLGVKLLVRTTRRITLTHEGSAFLEDCQRLLSDVVAVVGRFGPLGIAGLETLGPQLGGGGQGANLNARIVVIELAVDLLALRSQQIANRVAQGGLATVAHMQRAGGVG